MLNKKQYFLLLVLIVAVVLWFFVGGNTNEEGLGGNDITSASVEDLGEANELPVTIIEELEYFPGAKGYLVKPKDEGVFPAVILVHEAFGLRSEIKEIALSLGKLGYVVLAVDFFGRTVNDDRNDKELVASFDSEVGLNNMRAALTYVRDLGVGKVATLGFGFGGEQAVRLTNTEAYIDATVVYYGTGLPAEAENLENMTGAVLGIFGDDDTYVTVDEALGFSDALSVVGIENEIHIYPGVGHSFANPTVSNYATEEATDAWDNTLGFLKRHLGS